MNSEKLVSTITKHKKCILWLNLSLKLQGKTIQFYIHSKVKEYGNASKIIFTRQKLKKLVSYKIQDLLLYSYLTKIATACITILQSEIYIRTWNIKKVSFLSKQIKWKWSCHKFSYCQALNKTVCWLMEK